MSQRSRPESRGADRPRAVLLAGLVAGLLCGALAFLLAAVLIGSSVFVGVAIAPFLGMLAAHLSRRWPAWAIWRRAMVSLATAYLCAVLFSVVIYAGDDVIRLSPSMLEGLPDYLGRALVTFTKSGLMLLLWMLAYVTYAGIHRFGVSERHA